MLFLLVVLVEHVVIEGSTRSFRFCRSWDLLWWCMLLLWEVLVVVVFVVVGDGGGGRRSYCGRYWCRWSLLVLVIEAVALVVPVAGTFGGLFIWRRCLATQTTARLSSSDNMSSLFRLSS